MRSRPGGTKGSARRRFSCQSARMSNLAQIGHRGFLDVVVVKPLAELCRARNLFDRVPRDFCILSRIEGRSSAPQPERHPYARGEKLRTAARRRLFRLRFALRGKLPAPRHLRSPDWRLVRGAEASHGRHRLKGQDACSSMTSRAGDHTSPTRSKCLLFQAVPRRAGPILRKTRPVRRDRQLRTMIQLFRLWSERSRRSLEARPLRTGYTIKCLPSPIQVWCASFRHSGSFVLGIKPR